MRSNLALPILAGMLLLIWPAAGQQPQSAVVASAVPAGNAWRAQKLRARAQRRWEHHESKVQRRLEKQRINAVKRQQKKARPRRLHRNR